MQHLIHISNKVQELLGYSLAGHGRTDGRTNMVFLHVVQTKGRAIDNHILIVVGNYVSFHNSCTL